MQANTDAEERWTVSRLLSWAAEDFRQRGVSSARLDAELLLARATGFSRVDLIVRSADELSSEQLTRFRSLIKRRRAREPIAYILGVREFYGLSIRVNASVLIPRPDTETLVDVALARTEACSQYGRALDLCSGSGCVAIAFARRRPTWRVLGSDVSPDALRCARENALRCGAIFGLGFVQGDLFASVAPAEGRPVLGSARFNLITANPPYIPTSEMSELEPDIRDFEPRLALDGGADGLSLIQRIIREAPRFLTPGGVLALEVGAGQAPSVAPLFESAGFAEVERRSDYGGHQRVVSGVWPKGPATS